MRNIDVDFLARRHPPQLFSFLLALLMLIGAGITAWAYQDLRQEIEQANGALAQAQVREEGRRRPGSDSVIVIAPERVKAINAAIGELNVPWPAIFEALEEARPKDVALLHIEPDGGRSRLHVVAEAKTSQELTDFVSAVLERTPFRRFIPSRQEEVVSDGQSKIRLAFDLEWAK